MLNGVLLYYCIISHVLLVASLLIVFECVSIHFTCDANGKPRRQASNEPQTKEKTITA